MKTMQAKMLAQCKFDGSFPKPVMMPGGVLALARDEEQHAALLSQADWLLKFTVGCVIAAPVVTAAACWLLA